MTQKFYENETATIALYKYHDLLKCKHQVDDLMGAIDMDSWPTIQVSIEDLSSKFSDIILDRIGCRDVEIQFKQ